VSRPTASLKEAMARAASQRAGGSGRRLGSGDNSSSTAPLSKEDLRALAGDAAARRAADDQWCHGGDSTIDNDDDDAPILCIEIDASRGDVLRRQAAVPAPPPAQLRQQEAKKRAPVVVIDLVDSDDDNDDGPLSEWPEAAGNKKAKR